MSSWRLSLREHFYRMAATGWISRRLFLPEIPDWKTLPAKSDHLHLEIVSHCWNYSHLQAYQLSSLVLFPPSKISVQLTVFYSVEDVKTVELLNFFGQHSPPNVTWKWWPLERTSLFRRGIGRNLAARATAADWIWFTDCDQLFHRGCLDSLADQLSGRNDPLVFPTQVSCTALLDGDDELLQAGSLGPAVVQIDPERFKSVSHEKAIGALQIAHGDVARRVGYCDCIPHYQTPVRHWQKTFEDRAFRWLIGSQGTPINVPGLFRIEHIQKGRYESNAKSAWLRKALRRIRGR
ncbi:MAG: hypothetical protein NTW75_07295 [Planctomycetales bacterium]|nr:hypothetical protein [Planctomycetales bacterium]